LVLMWIIISVAAWDWRRTSRPDTLAQRLAAEQGVGAARPLDCADLRERSPIVLLALGQSNAGNHGQMAPASQPAVTIIHDGRCWSAQDPLPGGTGEGGSIWQPMIAQIQASAPQRPVVLAVLAVDASSSAEWIASGSPLRARLVTVLGGLSRARLAPHFVLWQQGEADARAGIAAPRYRDNLIQLQALLRDNGINAPILLAKSTVCRSAPSLPIRQAVDDLVALGTGFSLGPDTDNLASPGSTLELRRDGCHFSALGLVRAATLWADQLLPLLKTARAAAGAR
jgi:hypothetical protein